ncbi:MAG: AEC family transporter [Rhodospirillales bacterium]|nr:AEC family transporter [Rhodospirillales bacterium]
MNSVVAILIPFFAVIACGFMAARLNVLSKEGIGGLNAFVYYVALPALLFRVTAARPPAAIADFAFIGACAFADLALYGLGFIVARRAFRTSLADAAFCGLSASMANIAYLAIPLAIAFFGEDAAVPLMLCIIVDQTLLVPLTLVLVEAGKARERHTGAILRDILGNLASNPLLLGIAAGIAASAADVPIAGPFEGFVRLLAAAVAPCALFAVGATLVDRPSRAELAGAAAVSAMKLFLHPLAFWLAATFLFGVSAFAATVGVFAAAMPVSKTAFILAHNFKVRVAGTASAIVVSTVVSLVSVSVFAAILVSR